MASLVSLHDCPTHLSLCAMCPCKQGSYLPSGWHKAFHLLGKCILSQQDDNRTRESIRLDANCSQKRWERRPGGLETDINCCTAAHLTVFGRTSLEVHSLSLPSWANLADQRQCPVKPSSLLCRSTEWHFISSWRPSHIVVLPINAHKLSFVFANFSANSALKSYWMLPSSVYVCLI